MNPTLTNRINEPSQEQITTKDQNFDSQSKQSNKGKTKNKQTNNHIKNMKLKRKVRETYY